MKELELVSNWLNSVAYSHSQSRATEEQYKRVWEHFSNYIGKTAKEIITDYETSDKRTLIQKASKISQPRAPYN